MSDYTQITDFSAKDALSSGDPEKIISGADFDAELSAISVAVATKYDSTNIASQAEAEAESSSTTLMTPQRVAQWADDNAGIVGELRDLSDPGADRIFFWDDGESADSNVGFLAVGDGLEISTTTLQLPSSLAGAGLTLTSGVLAVVGGDGITANANDIALTDVAATTGNPVDVSSGSISLDLTALATVVPEGGLVAGARFLVNDAGTEKAILIEEAGMRVQANVSTQTVTSGDMNTIMELNGTNTLTFDTNANEALPLGVPIIICNDHASQFVTVDMVAGVQLHSVYHPGGTDGASDRIMPGGMAIIFQTVTDQWFLSGDLND